MASRSEAHQTLLLLFARDGVLQACTCYNAKEMIQGMFYPKLKDTERKIKELKKGTGHKLLWFRAPKHLWNDCLEMEAYTRSNTAHDIYKLDREVF